MRTSPPPERHAVAGPPWPYSPSSSPPLRSAAPLDAASGDTEATYTGCLKTTGTGAGTIVAVQEGNAPRRACTATEKAISVSGGDITSIAAGTSACEREAALGHQRRPGGRPARHRSRLPAPAELLRGPVRSAQERCVGLCTTAGAPPGSDLRGRQLEERHGQHLDR